MDYAFSLIFGNLPLWVQILILLAVGGAVLGLVRLYVGSWQLAASAAFGAVVVLLAAMMRGKAYAKGVAAEQKAARKAAEKRAVQREKTVDKVKSLPRDQLEKKASRWVKPDA